MEELRFYSEKLTFVLAGYVIMPDHVHLILWWDKEPERELTISKIMQGIKGAAAKRAIDLAKNKGLERMLQATHQNDGSSQSHRLNLRYRIWQPGFYDFNIYSEVKLREKLDYMHNNPVKAGLVEIASEYQWSSFNEYFSEEAW